MYNRYIPQPDGTYQRNRMQEPEKPVPPPPEPRSAPPPVPPVQEPAPCHNCIHHAPVRKPQPSRPQRPPVSITGFFKQLLPKNFDAEDLLVVLLLLLMSGDCQEDQNTALLTLALYLFL